jgi:predicted nucleotidyltransferase
MTFSCDITDKALQEITDAIVREVDPERIVLFGSRARGDVTGDSDVDLLVVERGSFGKGRSRRAELTKVERALIRFAVPTDILLYSMEELERWRGSLNHVIGRALREGKILYERH